MVHFRKLGCLKQLHWCGKKLLLCHSKILNIYRTISSTDTSNNIIRSNDNNDDEEEDISLGDKTEYNKRRWYKQCLDAFLKMLSSKWPINIFLCQTLQFYVILLVEFSHLFMVVMVKVHVLGIVFRPISRFEKWKWILKNNNIIFIAPVTIALCKNEL